MKLYGSQLICQEIWQDFTTHFKSSTTKGSYQTDIREIMHYFKRDFLEIGRAEAEEYFHVLLRRVEENVLKPGTMAKKFRELHSFAAYICENKERYGIADTYEDVYYPYLKRVAKQEEYARSVPVEHIDRLLRVMEHDRMAYCIVVLLYRAGLSSTEIGELAPEDFGQYDNGVYADIKGRREACYIPEDAVRVLEQYMQEREENPCLFYNSRGNKLNTMYISRMLKAYARSAGLPAYSAESIRNTCAFTMSAYGVDGAQTAKQMGITQTHIKRYDGKVYKKGLSGAAAALVKVRVVPPEK